ncbi:MAG: hypothetical protein MI723_09015, partial [Caulobacterales bacterium]|nr:hypothetical protein [Caulobacterales bacterium]
SLPLMRAKNWVEWEGDADAVAGRLRGIIDEGERASSPPPPPPAAASPAAVEKPAPRRARPPAPPAKEKKRTLFGFLRRD